MSERRFVSKLDISVVGPPDWMQKNLDPEKCIRLELLVKDMMRLIDPSVHVVVSSQLRTLSNRRDSED